MALAGFEREWWDPEIPTQQYPLVNKEINPRRPLEIKRTMLDISSFTTDASQAKEIVRFAPSWRACFLALKMGCHAMPCPSIWPCE